MVARLHLFAVFAYTKLIDKRFQIRLDKTLLIPWVGSSGKFSLCKCVPVQSLRRVAHWCIGCLESAKKHQRLKNTVCKLETVAAVDSSLYIFNKMQENDTTLRVE